MIEYEITNCRKNISFYKDQMRKNRRNNQFYAEQIEHMKNKMTDLQDSVAIPIKLSIST